MFEFSPQPPKTTPHKLSHHKGEKPYNHHRSREGKVYANNHHGTWDTRNLMPFCGVDGEGGNIEDTSMLPGLGMRHEYLLLRAGADVVETGSALTWMDCLHFLAALPQGRIYVGYFFDYDVNMILRQLSRRVFDRIYNRHLRVSNFGGFVPVTVGDFDLDYLPHKEFKVRRHGAEHWTIVSDVGQFFQSSFLTTLDKWGIGSAEQRREIARGKAERINFGHVTPETRYYNQLECDLLEQLMDAFRQVCKDVGYIPRKYQGPGYLAAAMLNKHAVPKRDEVPILQNEHFKQLANEAYYGGRFETTAAGPVAGPIYQYDINSAYPFAITTLPCLIHGGWRRATERPSDALWFGRVAFHHDGFRYLYNLPFRLDSGHIHFPRDGIGVYWSEEIASAELAGTEIDFQEGWVYEPHCDCQWFSFLNDVYQERLKIGKTTKGIVLKLGPNSIYGKLAQSIGYAPFANPVWAGLITARCRRMIIDAYSQAPLKTYMIATDGIFTGEPLQLDCGTGLGQWDRTEFPDGIFIVGPGIYYVGANAKTRGVERGRIHDMRGDFEAAWTRFTESHGEHHTVPIPVDNFITCSQASARNNWGIAGTWERAVKEISFDWSNKRKRIIGRFEPEGCRTLPPDGSPEATSKPYPRIIGGHLYVSPDERYTMDRALRERMEADQQPDWGDKLFADLHP